MKKTIKGVVYDTDKSQPLCTFTFPHGKTEVSETIYRTPAYQWFLVQRIPNKPDALFPLTADEVQEWSHQDADKPKPWKGDTKK